MNPAAAGSGASRALLIDVRYRIDNFMATTNLPATCEVMEKTGWVHMDRISAELREELKEKWLEWISADFGAKHQKLMADSRFLEITRPTRGTSRR